MLKAGKYHCKVEAPFNGWFGEAGEGGTPFLRLPLIVIKGQSEGEEIEYAGWLTDKSLDRTMKTLAEVFGFDGDLVALAKLTTTGPFVGKECEIVTEEEEYKGKRQVKIKWLNPVGGGGTLAPETARTLAARLQGRAMKAAAQPAGAPTPRPLPQRPPADPDLDAPEDDIPF